MVFGGCRWLSVVRPVAGGLNWCLAGDGAEREQGAANRCNVVAARESGGAGQDCLPRGVASKGPSQGVKVGVVSRLLGKKRR